MENYEDLLLKFCLFLGWLSDYIKLTSNKYKFDLKKVRLSASVTKSINYRKAKECKIANTCSNK